MKKYLMTAVAALAAASFTSCSNEVDTTPVKSSEKAVLKLSLSATPNLDSRSGIALDDDGIIYDCTILTFDLDGTIHHFHDTLCYRHSQSRTAIFICGTCIFLAKAVKQPWNILFTHAYSCITDFELQCCSSIKSAYFFNNQFNLSAFRSKLNSIS